VRGVDELPMSNSCTSDDHLLRVAGLRWPLLPCELKLVPLLSELSVAISAAEHDAKVVAVLRAHPFITSKGRPAGARLSMGPDLGECEEEHFRMHMGSFHKWLKQPEAAPFAKMAGGPLVCTRFQRCYANACRAASRVLTSATRRPSISSSVASESSPV